MKITPKHYDQLKDMLDWAVKKHGMSAKDFVAHYATFGLTQKRAVWDILWSVPRDMKQPWFDEVYKYANDDHIDTALRRYLAHS